MHPACGLTPCMQLRLDKHTTGPKQPSVSPGADEPTTRVCLKRDKLPLAGQQRAVIASSRCETIMTGAAQPWTGNGMLTVQQDGVVGGLGEGLT